jgi:hypothetical protein
MISTALAFILANCAAATAQEQDPPSLAPGREVTGSALSVFVQRGRAWLDKHPDSEQAPRVAMDLLMAAAVGNDQNLAKAMQAMLVLKYTDTLQGRYVVSLFKDAQDYRKFLSEIADRNLPKGKDDFAAAFCRAVRLGGERFGSEMLSDASFLLKCAVLADQAADRQIRDRALGVLKGADHADTEAPKVADVCFAQDTPLADKVIKLHGMSQADARTIMRNFLSRLPAAERTQPRIMRIVACEEMEDNNFAAALATIQNLPAEMQDDQVAFWELWCQFALGRRDKALAAAQELRKKHPDSPWSKAAAEYAAAIEGYEANFAANVSALLALSQQVRKASGAFETRLEVMDEAGRPKYRGFVATIPERGFCELLVWKNETPLLAYKTDRQSSQMYMSGWPGIFAFNSPGAAPVVNLDVVRDEAGKLKIEFGFLLAMGSAPASKPGKSPFESPYLNTETGLRELLASKFVATGVCPAAVSETRAGKVYAWLGPQTDSPELSRMELTIAPDGAASSVRLDEIHITNIRYGKAGEFTFTPQKWPEVQVISKDTMDMALFVEVMQGMFRLAGEVTGK